VHVDAPVLCMLESPARRIFKKIAGQNNHFLITIHVGLAAVEAGTATLPSDMRVSWDPRSRKDSAARSKGFANQAALAWLVDGVDAYIRALRNEPAIATPALRARLQQIDGQRNGIARKIEAVATATEQGGAAEAKLAEIAIVWRNRLVHQSADNRINKSLISDALSYSSQYAEIYQGLAIDRLIKHAELRPVTPPTLKEVTGIIRATHKLIERIDWNLLGKLQASNYLEQVLSLHLTSDTDPSQLSVTGRAGKIWGKSLPRRRSAIVEIARNNGFSEYSAGAPNHVTEEEIETLAEMTPTEAVAKLAPRSPETGA
jgi:hypothetical protein